MAPELPCDDSSFSPPLLIALAGCSNVTKPDFGCCGEQLHTHDTGYQLGPAGQVEGSAGAGNPSGPPGGPCSISGTVPSGIHVMGLEFVGYEASPTECAETPSNGGEGTIVRTGECPMDVDAEFNPCSYVAGLSEAPCDEDTDLRDANWTAAPGSENDAGYFDLDECYWQGECGECDPGSCGGYTYTFDPDGDEVVCGTFGPVRIDWWGKERTTPDDCTSDEAECTAGDGRFFLMPIRGRDADGDGFVTASYLPIQLTGSGVMTRLASVSEISRVTGPNSLNARVLRTRDAFEYDEDDQLVDASTISTVISGTHTFQQGDVAGNPIFVVEEVSEANVDAFTVDMEWTCPSGSGVTRSQGYQFRLSDIGCTGVNQKMTLRYTTSPNQIYLEQYGNSALWQRRPTVTVQDGQAFNVDVGGLHVEGVLLSADSQDAEVRFDQIKWKGNTVCDPDTYTFSVE